MGYEVGTRTIFVTQMRVAFLEYPPMLADEVLDMEKYAKRVGNNPQKMDVIDGDDVKQFSTLAKGSAWYSPDATKAATLFDEIAKNKSMALRLETKYTVEKLREAEKNKTVLSFVELALLEARQAFINGDHGLMTSPYKDARNLDTVRLNGCQVISAVGSSAYPLEVHFKAASADPRHRGGGGGCPDFMCGSNHNETFVIDA
jgi:hypothetical protein